MAITVSPAPADGPLSARGPNLSLTITTTSGCTLTAAVKMPTTGTLLRIETATLPAGRNAITLSLPPGGVPPGSRLLLIMDEPSGAVTVVKFELA